jgi:hypothetical protein
MLDKEKQIEEMAKDLYRKSYAYDTRWEEDCVELAEILYNAGYRKERQGEWMSAYDYALKLGITDEKRLADTKADKLWKFCNLCEQQVKGFQNYCPFCGAHMKGE